MIEVNGKDVEYLDGETISQMLKRLNYVFPMIVVKIDGQVVPKDAYDSTGVQDNSKIEVVHLISGG